MTPFTYRLYHKPTKMHYFGVRYSRQCHPNDLWTSYFTSSILVKELIHYFGKDSFEIRRIKVFTKREDAIQYENKFLTRIDAANNPRLLNQSNGGREFAYHPHGCEHWNYGRKHSAESIQKMKKTRSDETKHKISLAASGRKQTADHVSKRTAKNTGQTRSVEQRERMSLSAKKRCATKRAWVTKDGKDIQIEFESIETYMSQGFTRGRSKGMSGLKSQSVLM